MPSRSAAPSAVASADASGDSASARAQAPLSALVAAASAFFAGAAGLGLQAILAASASLPFGSGTGPALALAVYLSAWASGAWLVGRSSADPGRTILVVGAALFLAAPAATGAVLHGGSIAAVLGIAVAALLQGTYLPLLARGRASRLVAWLLAANLAGSWCGAFLIADGVVAASGRIGGAFAAGSCAVFASGLAFLVVRTRSASAANSISAANPSVVADSIVGAASGSRAEPGASHGAAHLGAGTSALVVGLGIAWMGGVEWSLVRLGALWFGGMQDSLTAVLAASLAALAIGAAILPPILPRGARGVASGLALCALGSLWILVVHAVLPNMAEHALWIRALVLCVPALAPFGALVPLVHRATAGESGARLGRLYLHESWGAWIGIPLVQFVLTPHIGLAASVGVTCALGAVAAVAIAPRAPVYALGAGVSALAAGALLARAEPPALRSPPLANPALTVLSFAEDRDFAVSVVDDGLLGERTLLTDGFRAAGTGRDYRYMRVLGHLPLLLHPNPERVAVLALGTGTTVGAVSLHSEVKRIDVLEIERAVVEAAPFFAEHNRNALAEGLPGLLDPDDGKGRVVVRLGDGRKTLRDSPATYDVVTMEPLLPDSPFGVHLYTEEAYADVKRALKPGGIACQWIPPHALEPGTMRILLDAFARSFAWQGAWISGTQIALIGAEREPALDPRRFEHTGELRAELDALGYGSPSATAAHWLGRLFLYQSFTRRLCDRDPWIAYRPRRHGAELLLDLPRNLQYFRLNASEVPVPSPAWSSVIDEPGQQTVRIARRLRHVREDHGFAEAALRGARFEAGPDRDGAERRLADLRRNAQIDAEAAEFLAEVAFLDDLRAGVAALAQDPSRDAAVVALDPLTRAATARRERADVHAYVAVALSRMKSPAADKAWSAALARCPRLAETDVGRRAKELGLAPDLWQRAIASALLASATSGPAPR